MASEEERGLPHQPPRAGSPRVALLSTSHFDCRLKLTCDRFSVVSLLNMQEDTRSLTLCQEAMDLHYWLISLNTQGFAIRSLGASELVDDLGRNRLAPVGCVCTCCSVAVHRGVLNLEL